MKRYTSYKGLFQDMEKTLIDEHYSMFDQCEEFSVFILYVHFSIYCFCVLNYNGQFSDMYKIVSMLKRLNYGVHVQETLKDETVKSMYETLTEKYS